jgi:hypothetical protein
MPPTAPTRYRLIPIVLTQVIGLGCGVASVRLNSHLIPPETLGFFGLFLTCTPLGMWGVNAGLLKYVSRHWAASPRPHALARELLAWWLRRLPWLALLAAIAAFTLLRSPAAAPVVVGGLLFVCAGLLGLGAATQAALQAERAHWRDCGVNATGSVLRSFAPPLLYGLWPAAASLLLGSTLQAVVAAAVGLWAVHSLLRHRTDDPAATSPVTTVYEGPLFTALALASWVTSGMNRWIVAGFFGEQQAGFFTLIGGIATVLTSMPAVALMQYVQPGLFALGDGGAELRSTLARRVDLVALAYAAVAGLALAAFHAALPWLVGPLISPAYRDAAGWLVPAGCFGIATLTAVVYHAMLLAGRRERACGPVDLTTAAVLAAGSVGSAAAGSEWFARWLVLSPLVPWLLTRTLARHYFFKPAPAPAS